MQIFPYNSKGITSSMSTRGRYVVNNGKILVNVIKEGPLEYSTHMHLLSVYLTKQKRKRSVSFFLLFIRLLYFRLPPGLLRQIIIFFWLPTCIVLQVKISGPISWYDILLVLKYVASSSLTKRLHKYVCTRPDKYQIPILLLDFPNV